MTNPLPPESLSCPACGAEVKRGARACVCGLPLPAPGNNVPQLDENLVVQAESLYTTYLASRLNQATKALAHARTGLRSDPWNALMVRRVREMEQTVAALRLQLATQETRTHRAREASVEKAAPSTDTTAPVVSPSPTPLFRENQLQKVHQIHSEHTSTDPRSPAPFITREELDDLRRNAPIPGSNKSRG